MGMQRMLILLGLAAFAIVGCGPKNSGDLDGTLPKKGEVASDQKKEPVDADAQPKEAESHLTQADLDKIPESLKHAGFRYYGFTYMKPMKYRVKTPNSEMEGSQVVKLKEVKDGNAIFELVGTDGLEQLGSQELLVKPDGVYASGMSMGKLEGTPLQVPSDLAIGKTWKSHQKIAMTGGTTYTLDQTSKVVRNEKVKVPAGEFDALYVLASGPYQLGSDKGTSKIETWLVQDVGIVKVRLSQTPAGQKDAQVSTFEMIP